MSTELNAPDCPAQRKKTMNPELLVNLPHGWVAPVAMTTGILSSVLFSVAALRDKMKKWKRVLMFAGTGILVATAVVGASVAESEKSRFEDGNAEAVSEWLDETYGFESSEEDRGDIARVIGGYAGEQSFTFGSDKGPVVAKVVEGPDGTFGLVAVAEPVKPVK